MKNGRYCAGQSDPARNPHFSRQWSEPLPCEGFKTIGKAAAEVVAHLPIQRKVERLHNLGVRALAEFLGELGAERGIMTIIDRKLARYAELEPEALEVTGGNDFSPIPIHKVHQP